MTRPIEFRLLSENNEIVGYEKWYVGSFNMEIKKDYYVAQPCWLYSIDEIYYNPTPINHRYKNQFTGLLDRAGKKIFESDLIKTADGYIHKIYWDCGMFLVDPGYEDHVTLFDATHDDCEIIGNIMENPELLK
jgi:hypothetical protein